MRVLNVSDQAYPEWLETVRQGLYAHNRKMVGSREFVNLALVAQDEAGQVLGGILGGSIWGWMLIETLWVAEAARAHGLGGELLARAEQAARERGCNHVILETFTFQALGFYQKRGYVVYAELDDFPPGHRRFSLKKDLG